MIDFLVFKPQQLIIILLVIQNLKSSSGVRYSQNRRQGQNKNIKKTDIFESLHSIRIFILKAIELIEFCWSGKCMWSNMATLGLNKPKTLLFSEHLVYFHFKPV